MSIAVALTIAGISALTAVISLFVGSRMRYAKKLRLLTLKALIINSALPLQERLEVYREYKRCGGNGWMDVYYHERLMPLIQAEIERLK